MQLRAAYQGVIPKALTPALPQVKMAASGRGEEPFREGEGRGFWTAARLLLGKMRSEGHAFHEAVEGAASSLSGWLGLGAAPRAGGEEEARLINVHASELDSWATAAGTFDLSNDLHAAEDLESYRRPQPGGRSAVAGADVLVFDFAPSYNFRVDRFHFDWELRRARRALRFRPSLEAYCHQWYH